MKIYYLILFLTISCNSQDKKMVNNLDNNCLMIEYNFYPSSGGNSIYSVTLKNGLIRVVNNEKGTIYSESISKCKNQDILKISEGIKESKNVETEIILDSWRIELKINNRLFFNESGIKIRDLPTDVKSLLELLIDNSNVKIDLYDFS